MNNQQQSFPLEQQVHEEIDNLEIGSEMTNEEKNKRNNNLDVKEEDKIDFADENEIENTIFAKPIVSKMNANIIQGESKTHNKPISLEKKNMISSFDKNLEKTSPKLESEEILSPGDKLNKSKLKRRMSRDDAGLNYNENPLDYLFPKEKDKNLESPPKKFNKECEDVDLETFHRNPELSKSFSTFSDKKNDRPSSSRTALSTSVILDNKKYKIILRKSANFIGRIT